MSKFKITLAPSGRIEKHVSFLVDSDSWTTADDLAGALAELMPEQTYYCQKNSRDITTGWNGEAEEQGE